MKIKALVPGWYGGNRMGAERVGELLRGCEWVGVACVGGFSEVRCIESRTILVNDTNLHLMNLARVAAHPVYGAKLWRRLRRVMFDAETLGRAQQRCRDIESSYGDINVVWEAMLDWAINYFICATMGRNGTAGTKNELKAGISVRYNASGGDSVVRFRGAIDGLRDWRNILSRCQFCTDDIFDFLDKCHDKQGHGVYVDCPWPDDGKNYRGDFDEAKQRKLASRLECFDHARVVVRFGDHPLVRELYPVNRWNWIEVVRRTQANKDKAEGLLTRNM